MSHIRSDGSRFFIGAPDALFWKPQLVASNPVSNLLSNHPAEVA